MFLVDVLIAWGVPAIIGFVLARPLTWSGLWGPTLGGPLASSGGGGDTVAMWNSMGWMERLAVMMAFNVGALLYFSLCHSSPWQATVGKRWRHLIVTDKNGSGIGFLRALIRAFVKTCLTYPFFPGLAIQAGSVAATKRKRAIHDFIAGTVVVRGQPPATAGLGSWRVAVFLLVPPVFLFGSLIVSGDFQLFPG